MSDQEHINDLNRVFEKQKAAWESDPYPTVEVRKDRIERMITLLDKFEKPLCDAMDADFGGRSAIQSFGLDFVLSIAELKHARRNLAKFMKPVKRSANFPLGLLGARAQVFYEPKGVVANIATWNFPVAIYASPLGNIFAAGNRCIVKNNEFTPETGKVFQEAVRSAFDDDELAVVLGGAEVSAAVCALPLDHILFTGSERGGRLVMAGAAQNLVPVTLELGGKCPTIVSASADIDTAAAKIIYGKMTNAGQICLAPDFVSVQEDVKDKLVEGLVFAAQTQFSNAPANDDYTAIISDQHVNRLQGLVDDAREKGAKITVVDGEAVAGISKKLPLHIVEDVTDDMQIMQEEIFGPLLPVKTWKTIDEVVTWSRLRAKPLASYYFGRDKGEEMAILEGLPSGSTTLNDVLFHALQTDLPFGGVGASGMGQYHGYEGFQEFSNPRAIYKQSWLDIGKMLRPPFTSKTYDIMRKLV